MNKKRFKKVLVVLGGTSGERKVSLDSGKACIKALKKKKYLVKIFDPKLKNFNLIDKQKIDVIFNALHGKDGEDGVAQSYFEYLNIPYTHSGVISSYTCMNKIISKEIFIKNGILTPSFLILKKENLKDIFLKRLLKKKRFSFPLVVKPINEGSSLGVKIIKNFKALKKSLLVLFKKYRVLIIEKFIGGQEIQAAVINKVAIGAIELIPKRSFYDYKAKYTKSAKTEHVMPARLNKKKYKEVLKIAEAAHKALKCRGVTRSDFKFYKNKFYLLEINTQPGMTPTSLSPEQAFVRGISFDSFCDWIVEDASCNR